MLGVHLEVAQAPERDSAESKQLSTLGFQNLDLVLEVDYAKCRGPWGSAESVGGSRKDSFSLLSLDLS